MNKYQILQIMIDRRQATALGALRLRQKRRAKIRRGQIANGHAVFTGCSSPGRNARH